MGDQPRKHNWGTSKNEQGKMKSPHKSPLSDCSLNVGFGVQSHQDLLRDKQNVSQIVYRRSPRKSTCHPLPLFFFFPRASPIEWASNASYFYVVHAMLSLISAPHQSSGKALRESKSHMKHIWAKALST